MKQLIQSVLIAFLLCALCAGCSKSNIISQSQFTTEFAKALRKSSPGLTVEIVQEMQLKVTTADSQHFMLYLNNAYDEYKGDPKSKEAVVKKFLRYMSEIVSAPRNPEGPDRAKIIPVVKNRAWLEETARMSREQGGGKLPDLVYDDLNADLIIVYAEDSAKNVRYFSTGNLEKGHIERKELRKLASENLLRILPQIEQHEGDGLYMLTAGRAYETSLLLIDSIWTRFQKEVKGRVVVAIPMRGLLLVAGSDDAKAMDKMKQIVKEASSQGSYRISSKLFSYQAGKWVEFER